MPVNPNLQAAVKVFHKLGWNEVTRKNLMELPTGTSEQRAVAVAGLKSGAWETWDENLRRPYNHAGVKLQKLALFAIRMGVSAPRTVSLLNQHVRSYPASVLFPLIAQRGEKFATQFIKAVYGTRVPRPSDFYTSFEHHTTCIRLVAGLGGFSVPVPAVAGYIQDWSTFMVSLLPEHLDPTDTDWMSKPWHMYEDISFQTCAPLFREHVEKGIATNVSILGSFGKVLVAGALLGLLERDEVLTLLMQRLETAQRPVERHRMVEYLVTDLAITDAEMLAHLDLFIAALATSDATYCSAFGPKVIALAPEPKLVDAAIGPLHLTTATGQHKTLKSLLDKPVPTQETIATLEPRIRELAGSRNSTVAKLAGKLLEHWNLHCQAPHAVTELLPWQATPPLWNCPKFDKGPVTLEGFIDAERQLTPLRVDIHSEKRDALLVALANDDMGVARRAASTSTCYEFQQWARGEEILRGSARRLGVMQARAVAIADNLGTIPVLLSEPTYQDLSIDFTDLMQRLAQYQAAGVEAMEPDLQLALFRLNLDTADPELALECTVPVRVLRTHLSLARKSAGDIIAAYIRDPLPEPPLDETSFRELTTGCNTYAPDAPLYPRSIRNLPNRLSRIYTLEKGIPVGLFPAWRVAPTTRLVRSSIGKSRWTAAEIACDVTQLARSRQPLGAGFVMNLLALQQPGPLPVHEKTASALFDAWDRGLLIPGVADATLVEWAVSPTKLKGLGKTLEQLAHEGLLSLVWPVLDPLLQWTMKAPKSPAGTSEIAEAILSLVPSVIHAVVSGEADANQLKLPGVQHYAAQPQSNNTTKAARKTLTLIPAELL
ncbi:DUF6493 family protein [Corynebacterium felinum]|uniref:DUF7824 domain-containing protein n=2 Tax=Corynebacterium felinum TaxID=131318 RepID=A0ABU2BE53_9CORY|nr:DUF6493 family protein [Corynebacterium felinum]MDF5821590.1 DUF6493 family protein [Corynebacterium felinum]MDR7356249.1 hypothetical protein [Corynebacterium felinum]WJY95582.1 hypothetical protein CFELI_09905 [Corynebacterium felinum]